MAKSIGLTKKLTGSAVISTAGKSAIVRAISLQSGTGDATIRIKNGGASGTELWRITANGTTAAGETTTSISFTGTENNRNGGIICDTDAFGTMSGTAAVAWVFYDEIED